MLRRVDMPRINGQRVHDEGKAAVAIDRHDDDISGAMADVQVVDVEAGNACRDDRMLQEAKSKAFSMEKIKQFIGADVLSLLSVPVFIMEPTSMLQKMGEIMEYVELLDQADAAQDPIERMVLVAAYLTTPFGACERAWKPFNPLLGETFEMEGLGPQRDARYFAEQVTHHPPIGVAHAESPRWEYDIVSAPRTRFLGNSLEVFPNGRTRIKLRGTQETYTHVPPHAKVHNLILGRTWIDAEGDFYVYCPETGVRCDLKFKPCGWFNAGKYEFSGHVTDAAGARRVQLSGRWCSHIDAVASGPNGAPLPGAAARRLWTCTPKPAGDYYGMTLFARRLSSCAALRLPPLPSDSRRRPDREELSHRHMPRAAAQKTRLEEGQRRERAHRERGGGAAWAPRWFDLDPAPQLLPGEMDAERVPAWRWREGNFEAIDRQLATHAGAAPGAAAGQQPVGDAAVCGQGFAPWQFPELH